MLYCLNVTLYDAAFHVTVHCIGLHHNAGSSESAHLSLYLFKAIAVTSLPFPRALSVPGFFRVDGNVYIALQETKHTYHKSEGHGVIQEWP
jgi:hypothetical protein